MRDESGTRKFPKKDYMSAKIDRRGGLAITSNFVLTLSGPFS